MRVKCRLNGGCQRTKSLVLAVQSSLPLHFFCEKCFLGGAFLFYQDARDYITNIERGGSDYGIERMRELLTLLDNPDYSLKFVHVAGTNGKGSVTAYLTSVLLHSGYRVGTYNSPSVFDYNERWLIDGLKIDDDSVAYYLTLIRDTIEQEQTRRKSLKLRDFKPTAFEIETALAFMLFKDRDCNICVIETGLGGRWDATNVIEDKEIAIITPIGLDHCGILGNTLYEVASEKAGIIKDKAITIEQCADVMRALKNPFDLVGEDRIYKKVEIITCCKPLRISSSVKGQAFLYNNKEYSISMLGAHQLDNASIVICAVEELRNIGWNISEKALKDGLKDAIWHARFEVVNNHNTMFNITIPQDKTLVFDGAHNPHGALTLAKGIEEYFDNKPICFVMGVLKDKDVDGIVDIVYKYVSKVYTITPNSPRALDREILKETFINKGVDAISSDDIYKAIGNALNGDCEVVIVCGSLTLFAPLVSKEYLGR